MSYQKIQLSRKDTRITRPHCGSGEWQAAFRRLRKVVDAAPWIHDEIEPEDISTKRKVKGGEGLVEGGKADKRGGGRKKKSKERRRRRRMNRGVK